MNFRVRNHLTQIIKVNMSSNKSCRYHGPPGMMWWGHFTSVVFFHQTYNPNRIMRKHQTNPNWGISRQNTGPVLFKSVKVIISKERLKRRKLRRQDNWIQDGTWDWIPEQKKDIRGRTGEIGIKCLVNSVSSMSISQFWHGSGRCWHKGNWLKCVWGFYVPSLQQFWNFPMTSK